MKTSVTHKPPLGSLNPYLNRLGTLQGQIGCPWHPESHMYDVLHEPEPKGDRLTFDFVSFLGQIWLILAQYRVQNQENTL